MPTLNLIRLLQILLKSLSNIFLSINDPKMSWTVCTGFFNLQFDLYYYFCILFLSLVINGINYIYSARMELLWYQNYIYLSKYGYFLSIFCVVAYQTQWYYYIHILWMECLSVLRSFISAVLSQYSTPFLMFPLIVYKFNVKFYHSNNLNYWIKTIFEGIWKAIHKIGKKC